MVAAVSTAGKDLHRLFSSTSAIISTTLKRPAAATASASGPVLSPECRPPACTSVRCGRLALGDMEMYVAVGRELRQVMQRTGGGRGWGYRPCRGRLRLPVPDGQPPQLTPDRCAADVAADALVDLVEDERGRLVRAAQHCLAARARLQVFAARRRCRRAARSGRWPVQVESRTRCVRLARQAVSMVSRPWPCRHARSSRLFCARHGHQNEHTANR